MQHNLYREEILEHYRDPQNFGQLTQFDRSSKQLNPFCGDEISIYIKFFSPRHPELVLGSHRQNGERDSGQHKAALQPRMTDKVVEDISFVGTGCAISMAAASMLTEHARKKSIKELSEFSETNMLYLLNIEISESRKKCALLALYTLRDCINSNIKVRNPK